MTRQWSIRRAARFLCGITASLALALAPSVCCAAQPGLPPSQALAAQSAPAAGTAPSQAPLVEGEVTLRVDALAPEVLTKGQDLTVSGTITNGTQETLDGVALSVQVQDHTEIITTDLESWLADERGSSLTTSLTQDLHTPVPPGATGTFSVTVPAADLPLVAWVQAATAEGVRLALRDRSRAGDRPFDLLILDAEAKKLGGMGLAHELYTEMEHRPPVVLLTARPQDRWLAAWARADAVVPRPLDTLALAQAVASVLRHPAAA